MGDEQNMNTKPTDPFTPPRPGATPVRFTQIWQTNDKGAFVALDEDGHTWTRKLWNKDSEWKKDPMPMVLRTEPTDPFADPFSDPALQAAVKKICTHRYWRSDWARVDGTQFVMDTFAWVDEMVDAYHGATKKAAKKETKT